MNQNISKIYLSGAVDMRKQMNDLLALVEGSCQMDPYEKALFVFTNKRGTRSKRSGGMKTVLSSTTSTIYEQPPEH